LSISFSLVLGHSRFFSDSDLAARFVLLVGRTATILSMKSQPVVGEYCSQPEVWARDDGVNCAAFEREGQVSSNLTAVFA
jgi:hypothetical protein